MTATEMSLAFDRLYDNIMSNQAPGLNEYEKSCFLSEAQEALVSTLCEQYETVEGMRDTLAPLLKTVTVQGSILEDGAITEYSYLFELPTDIWYKCWEGAVLSDAELYCRGSHRRSVEVVPCRHNDLARTVASPFRGPNERRVLRVDCGDGLVELISKYEVDSYTLRYVSKPSPIIIESLSSTELTINGETDQKDCVLPEKLHMSIVEAAVLKAKAVWSQVGIGNEENEG